MNSEGAVTTDAQTIGREAAPLSDSIRITRQGKIRHWVKHGLNFFEVWLSMIFLLLPSTVKTFTDAPLYPQNNPDKPLTLQTAAADVAQSTIPRLISVVEILKREYLKALDVSSGQLTGLHQYNELYWERRGEIPAEGEDRPGSLIRALEGKNQCVFSLSLFLFLARTSPQSRFSVLTR